MSPIEKYGNDHHKGVVTIFWCCGHYTLCNIWKECNQRKFPKWVSNDTWSGYKNRGNQRGKSFPFVLLLRNLHAICCIFHMYVGVLLGRGTWLLCSLKLWISIHFNWKTKLLLLALLFKNKVIRREGDQDLDIHATIIKFSALYL